MSADDRKDELKSREVAEAAREKTWRGQSFIRDLFHGQLNLDLLDPWQAPALERPAFKAFHAALRRFLEEKVDPQKIDETGEYPREVVEGLAALGAFGMKIPTEYGGLGLTHPEYVKVMELLGSYDGNTTALLSAHQAIGVPQPVKLFGTEELKREYLPRCAKGAISAFALTEPAVGSDPARLATSCVKTPEGDWLIDGQKLWCTNGTLAELLVVMARDPSTEKINAFVVETAWPGVKVEGRCRFMGLKALANAVISFDKVRVPARNLIGGEGAGLKIALVTLNTGRLSLPAATTGLAKTCLETMRKWAAARVQWGHPVGKHEAIAHVLADTAATTFAMESIAELVGTLADRPGADIRLEAAAAKEWNTTRAWRIVDQTLQVRGGRGYETEASLEARGEPPIGVERWMRDCRINLIFEGSSEVMHLFMAREAVDRHLQVAGALVSPKATVLQKVAALPKIAAYYAWWYPTRFVGWGRWPRFGRFGRLAKHVRWADRAARKLAREVFHGMVVNGPKLERKQAFLFRAVDIAMEVFATMTAVCRARALGDAEVIELADLFARGAQRRVAQLFKELWANDDAVKTAIGHRVLAGERAWLERGGMGVPYGADELRPPSMEEIIAARSQPPKAPRDRWTRRLARQQPPPGREAA
jgi:alkylation response protein AidB-like acyl-CoA dehydrogenase